MWGRGIARPPKLHVGALPRHLMPRLCGPAKAGFVHNKAQQPDVTCVCDAALAPVVPSARRGALQRVCWKGVRPCLGTHEGEGLLARAEGCAGPRPWCGDRCMYADARTTCLAFVCLLLDVQSGLWRLIEHAAARVATLVPAG